ncbi:response regulator [Microbacterium schleiferi]|uniref:Response regulator n=1 Tax=Microbacterium schleiferi TaxID=69362 RepID=A0A7S8RH02_9MICO|nr:response regulator transcription factor [Microbacterium schleiferi]QPE04946.1 response regulator [Microbacterium schleiferi]
MSTDAGVSKTAVIVEDDPQIRHILAETLEAAGFSTVSVGNGIDGVRAVLSYQPLITTLDVNMPGIDGFEAARRIRAQSDTYIIMLTGLEDEADVVLGLGAGADEYIVKPFRPRELRARIEALLRRPRQSPTAAQQPVQAPSGPSFPGARPAIVAQPAVAPGTIPASPQQPFATVDPSGAVTPGDPAQAPGQHPSQAPAGYPAGQQPPSAPPQPGYPAQHPGYPQPGSGQPYYPPTPQGPVDPPGAGGNQQPPGSQLVARTPPGAPMPGPGGHQLSPSTLRHRDLILDPDSRIVLVGNREVELTRTEFELLATLMESKRRVRSKADLTLVLRGESYVTSYFVGDADKRAIEAHMTNLRRKLGDDPNNPRYVETVRGVGYRMTSENVAPPPGQ